MGKHWVSKGRDSWVVSGINVFSDLDGFRIYIYSCRYLDSNGVVCDVSEVGKMYPTLRSEEEVDEAISLYLLKRGALV